MKIDAQNKLKQRTKKKVLKDSANSQLSDRISTLDSL